MTLPQAAPTAFFSYAREDAGFALRLAEDLKAAGASVWLDQLDIRPGQRWDRAVEEALNQCDRMLVVLTPAAVNSTNVMDEVSFALEEHKTVIPIVHRDCVIPFRLRRVQHLDFRQDYARALSDLIRTLGSGTPAVVDTPVAAVTTTNAAEIDLRADHAKPFRESRPRDEGNSVEQPARDAGARIPLEPHRAEERSRLPQHEQRVHTHALPAVGVVDQPQDSHAFELAGVWPLVDRFGAACWLILAVALPAVLGVPVLNWLSPTPWSTRLLGLVCPAIAAIVPAVPVQRVVVKYVSTIFGLMALLTPLLSLHSMSAGIRATGSVSLGAVSAGLSDFFLTMPFVVAGAFAIGATMLPTSPAGMRSMTRAGLIAVCAVVVLVVAMNVRALVAISSANNVTDLPWLTAWLIDLVTPNGVPGIHH